ncbi:MAG: flagellar basal body-associated FliL family protein [Deltaproteobacteria bacterium]|jgi:flagellar FliL protein|nr:flagellar basal body-associated FliL family protein [Deltaproteobacteria bacterium]
MANADKTPKKQAQQPQEDPRAQAPPSGAQAPPPGKSGKLVLIVLVLGAMVVGGAGAFMVLKFMGGGGDKTQSAEEAPPPETDAAAHSAAPPAPTEDEEPITAPSKSGRSGGGAAAESGHGAGGAGEGQGAEVTGPVTVKLDPFTTNLNSSGGRAFIKLTMSFEVDGSAGADQLTAKMDDVRDAIITLLMSVSADDISTPDGILRLKTQIQSRVNNLLPDYKVRKVNITDIAIQ